jgi:hypothetical protein
MQEHKEQNMTSAEIKATIAARENAQHGRKRRGRRHRRK